MFNLLPNLSNPTASTSAELKDMKQNGREETTELARAMSVKTNDQLMAIYLSSLIRAITAFHDLIENKIQNRQQQEEKDSKKDGGDKDKDKENDKDKDKDKEESRVDGEKNGVNAVDEEPKAEGKDKGGKGKQGEKKR